MYKLHVQSHPEDRGDFGQGSTNDISESTFRMELSIHGLCCSYVVLANPNMKLRIQFIIMKIFMKVVKICPKVTPIYGMYFLGKRKYKNFHM